MRIQARVDGQNCSPNEQQNKNMVIANQDDNNAHTTHPIYHKHVTAQYFSKQWTQG
jgi:hypothetical protein